MNHQIVVILCSVIVLCLAIFALPQRPLVDVERVKQRTLLAAGAQSGTDTTIVDGFAVDLRDFGAGFVIYDDIIQDMIREAASVPQSQQSICYQRGPGEPTYIIDFKENSVWTDIDRTEFKEWKGRPAEPTENRFVQRSVEDPMKQRAVRRKVGDDGKVRWQVWYTAPEIAIDAWTNPDPPVSAPSSQADWKDIASSSFSDDAKDHVPFQEAFEHAYSSGYSHLCIKQLVHGRTQYLNLDLTPLEPSRVVFNYARTSVPTLSEQPVLRSTDDAPAPWKHHQYTQWNPLDKFRNRLVCWRRETRSYPVVAKGSNEISIGDKQTKCKSDGGVKYDYDYFPVYFSRLTDKDSYDPHLLSEALVKHWNEQYHGQDGLAKQQQDQSIDQPVVFWHGTDKGNIEKFDYSNDLSPVLWTVILSEFNPSNIDWCLYYSIGSTGPTKYPSEETKLIGVYKIDSEACYKSSGGIQATEFGVSFSDTKSAEIHGRKDYRGSYVAQAIYKVAEGKKFKAGGKWDRYPDAVVIPGPAQKKCRVQLVTVYDVKTDIKPAPARSGYAQKQKRVEQPKFHGQSSGVSERFGR